MEGIIDLYVNHFGGRPQTIAEIPCAVSTRRYFRLSDGNSTVIGTYSPDVKETIAFTTFSSHFRKKGLAVPEVLAVSADKRYYLQQDLGNSRFHEMITAGGANENSAEIMNMYLASIDQLVKLQIEGDEGLDYSVSVPRAAFDRQSVLWDLNHFKYYFLKPLGLPFDENLLEEAFIQFADYIAALPLQGFMFRDFQSRNIMIVEDRPWFIDFQGGRKGPLQYDLASLVFESKAGLSEENRMKIIEYYLKKINDYRPVDSEQFKKDFYAVALVRMLQVLGAYGLRGNIEKKAVFLQSIPGGLNNLELLLKGIDRAVVPEPLFEILIRVAGSKNAFRNPPEPFDGLTITITSFSYRKPLPDDLSGNGGGFVYDCRFLNNPGRIDQYKEQTGLDEEVRLFLKTRSDADEFVNSIKDQLQSAIAVYKGRNFRHLMVSFGCTGGRHRSVYVARAISDWCRRQGGVRVFEIHREIGVES